MNTFHASLNNSAVVTGIDGKTAQAIRIGQDRHGISPNSRLILVSAFLLSAAISSLSNGATVQLQEVDTRIKIAASLSTSLTGANNDLVFTARTAGLGGNSIRVRYVDPSANNAALGVVVSGLDITVNLATGGGGAITSTGATIAAAVAASTAANALVSVANKGGDTGAGVVIAMSYAALTSGLDWTVIQTLVASVDLADTDAVDTIQALTVATTNKVINGDNELVFQITGGSTATTDTKNLLLNFIGY